MKFGIASTDRVVVELDANDLMNIEAALLGFHRDQQNMQTPFGIRVQDLAIQMRQAQNAMWEQDARARGLTVEGDAPVAGGAF